MNKDTKKFNIAIDCGHVSYRRFIAEVRKCVLLCRSCHTAVSWKERRERLGVCEVDIDDDVDDLIPVNGRKLKQ
jgi:hypothetical protein